MSLPEPALRTLGERIAREEDALLARPLPPGESTFRGPRRPVRRPAVRLGLAAAVSLVLVAAASWLFVRARPLGLTVAGETAGTGSWISAPAETPIPIRFSEGTEVVLAPQSHARVVDVTRKGARVLLESGTAHVSVTPHRGGEWTFTAGPFQVDVKGTRFELAWAPDAQRFRLDLLEGNVFISGCGLGEGHPLAAGETLTASCLTREFHIDGPASTTPLPVTPPAPSSEAPSAEAPSPASLDPDESATRSHKPADRPLAPRPHGVEGDETWQSLARGSHFKEALARVNDRGFDAELSRASRDDLLLLGDVARLGGDSGKALQAYERVRSRAPGTEAAANAAFAMGRVYFDQRSAYADAARWFATYRAERGTGPLARDATGRQMEALSRAGDTGTAARVATDYLRRYPGGPHAPLARTLALQANQVE